jgi:hypothetical protein
MVFLDMTPFGVKTDAYKPSGPKKRAVKRVFEMAEWTSYESTSNKLQQ